MLFRANRMLFADAVGNRSRGKKQQRLVDGVRSAQARGVL
jgi:hypothetical protein